MIYLETFKKALRVTLICRDFKITEEGNYLFYSPDEQNNFNNTLSLKPGVIHVSGDGSFAKPILSLGDSNFPPLLASRSFVNFDKEIYLFSNYSDTVFQISDDKITNRYLMDYGVGNRVEENNITSSNFNFGNTDFPFLKLNPMVTDKFIGYTFMYRGKDKSLIDRSNLKAEIYRGIINDIDSGFFVLNGSTINKNIYVSYLTSEMADAYSQYLYKENQVSQIVPHIGYQR